MANPTGKGGFQKGQSGNPAGRLMGSRQKLNEKFITALAADFEKNGTAAVKKLREKDLGSYMRIVAGLQPKEIEASGPGGGPIEVVDDYDLARRIALILSIASKETDDALDGEPSHGEDEKGHEPAET